MPPRHPTLLNKVRGGGEAAGTTQVRAFGLEKRDTLWMRAGDKVTGEYALCHSSVHLLSPLRPHCCPLRISQTLTTRQMHLGPQQRQCTFVSCEQPGVTRSLQNSLQNLVSALSAGMGAEVLQSAVQTLKSGASGDRIVFRSAAATPLPTDTNKQTLLAPGDRRWFEVEVALPAVLPPSHRRVGCP